MLGAVVGAAGIFYSVGKSEDEYIMFPRKSFIEYGDGFRLEGSLVGEGEDRPINGFLRIECQRGNELCEMISVNQISGNFVSNFWEDSLRVEEWSDTTVRLTSRIQPDEPLKTCNYFEIRIDLATETATYTRIPSPNPDENCTNVFGSNAQTMQWRIDDGYRTQELDRLLAD